MGDRVVEITVVMYDCDCDCSSDPTLREMIGRLSMGSPQNEIKHVSLPLEISPSC